MKFFFLISQDSWRGRVTPTFSLVLQGVKFGVPWSNPIFPLLDCRNSNNKELHKEDV